MWILHILTVSFPIVSTCSIGYPVVYLGFYATCYFTNIFKLRVQKAVQNENDFNMHLLQRSLPPGLQVYPKTGTDGSSESLCRPFLHTHFPFYRVNPFHFVPLAKEYSWVSSAEVAETGIMRLQWPRCNKLNFWGHQTAAVWSRIEITVFFLFLSVLTGSKWKTKPESSQYQCQNGAVLAHDDGHTVDCLQIRSVERVSEKGAQEVRSAESNRRQSSSKLVEPRELLHCGTGRLELSTTPENLPQDEQGNKATRMAKSSSPKARRGSTNTPSPPTGRMEKKQRSSSKSVSPNWDATDKNATTAQNHHAEQMTKYGDVHLRSVCFEIRRVQVKAEL